MPLRGRAGGTATRPSLRACVVVPARDEQEHVGACIAALATQDGVRREDFEVVLVCDACVDDTRRRALAAARGSGLRIVVLDGPGAGAGAARRVGMDHAAARLAPSGLIACTDADTVVAPDWLQRQLDAIAAGADAVAGLVTLDVAGLHPGVLARRREAAVARLGRVRAHSPDAEHHHFAGASMGLTAAAYRRLGGIEPLVALEDDALERRLRGEGLRIARRTDVQVTTSGRLVGRAARGLAHDLACFEREARRQGEPAA